MRTGPRAATLLALCCTAVAGLTGCGGPARGGYVAVGAAAPGPERGPGENVAPQGRVEFQQLGGPSAAGGSSDSSSLTSTGTPGSEPPGGSARGGATPTGPGGSADGPGTPPGAGPATTPPGSPGGSGGPGGSGTPSAPGTPGTPTAPGTKPGTTPPAPPATPARLTLSTPARAAAADRWCERVTVTFTNTGGTAARSGTVGFATHIIGALGIDWATITTTQPLPAPIAGGSARTQTYTVCVEAWRVPLGMRVETQKVTATWS
ncbi:hypothetical protein ACFTWH_19755 [Streptomyces sp. NPDC057011]|uniref:hypothetical protein n=1 Tax=unclassified Streptomyces TaxID=2593676 RepID=UPI003635C044